VFVVKYNKDGTVNKHKARLVAKGYSQCPGFDFTKTVVPTAKWAALRAVLALAALISKGHPPYTWITSQLLQ